jgi:AsmA protein
MARPVPTRHAGEGQPGGARWATARAVVFYAALALLALVAASATFLIVAPPTELVRDRIVAEVKASTGRELVIAGPASFTFRPSLGVKLRDVSLAAPPGIEGEPTLRAASLEARVRLLPLLQRQVTVERIVLHEPVIDLRIDADGRRNWERAQARPKSPVEVAQARSAIATYAADPLPGGTAAHAPVRGERLLARLQHLELGELLIENGTLRYRDARSGAAHDIEAINARLGFDALSRPLDIEASLAWRGERVELDGRLTAPADIIAGQPARLALSLAGAHGTASYDGTVSVQGGLLADGMLKGETLSARGLARWLGARLPAAGGFGPATLEGRVATADSGGRLSDATLTLDGATATGTLALDLSGAKPLVSAALQLGELDLNAYLAPTAPAADEAPARTAPSSSGTAGSAGPSGPRSIDDLLNTAPPGPRVKGFARRGGWSEAPFDAGDLGRIDLDTRLDIGGIQFRNLRTGPGAVAVALKNNVLRASSERLDVYGGRGRGVISIDGTGDEPVLEVKAAVEGVSVQPLLKDTAATDWIAGTGNVTLALAARGRSERALVETLSGKASFTVADGALVGWSLPHTIGALRRGRLGSPEKAGSQTEFSELAGSVVIDSGVAHNQDLRLTTPLARVTGAGTVQLAERRIDYVLRPKLVAAADGQGGAPQTAGLEVPVKVQGSWDDPHITTDLSGVVQNPGQAWEAVKEIGKQFKGKKADEVVKGLLGNEPGQSDKAKQFLNQFLKRQ